MKVRQFLRDLAGLDDPPHKIALGMALGIFVGFLPIMGIQMGVVLPLALLCRANKVAAVGGVWITNPITVIPIYYLDYQVGQLFGSYPALRWAHFENLFTSMTLNKFIALGESMVAPLFIGGTVLGVVAGIPTYAVARRLVVRARKRRAARRAKRSASA